MKLVYIFTCIYLFSISGDQDVSVLDNYPLGTNQFVQFRLKPALNEISGLTLADGERLFGHDDEKAAVYQIDYNTSEIIKTFYLGALTINGDFEDIAYAKGYFYLITSEGILYKFKEGSDGANVDYNKINLKVSDKFDIEGLCHDPVSNSLLVVSKDYPGNKYEGTRTVYEYDINKSELNKKPRYVISLKKLKKDFDIKDFYPSSISIHPDQNSSVLLSSKGKPCLVEISREGKLTNARKLNQNIHRQPEGLTFLKDGTMIIADEASGKKPTLTKYFPLSYK